MRRDGPRPAGVASAGARPGGVAQSGVTYGYACDQNVRHRNYMEDEHCVARLDELRPGAVWFGLFDGHGGRTACELAVSQLHKTFVNEAEAGGIGTRQQVGAQGLHPPRY
jgi:serine/threonine protein phosphatase PrpC